MEKINKDLKTKNFSISDKAYSDLSNHLSNSRKAYKVDIPNFYYFKKFEEYLYDHKKRRDPFEEINRFKNYDASNLLGDFDTSNYLENFRANVIDSLDLRFQNLKGCNHLRSSKLYKNKLKTKKLIESLIDPIEKKISNILDSKFIITKIEEVVTLKGKDDHAHFWHFDPVPLGYGKVFFYFSSSEETDGKTKFISPMDSFKLLQKGYNNIPLSKRSKNLQDFSEAQEIRIGDKGKYMIFLSGMMLHRGSYPTFGKRKIISINFLRSNHYWKDVFDELWSIDKLSGKWIPSNWPQHNIKIDL